MDKTGIIVVAICALLLGYWFIEQTKEQQKLAALQEQARRQFDATNVVTASASTPAAANLAPSAPVANYTYYSFDTNSPEQTLVLTNSHARYTFTSRGGGLKLVELLDYPETISARWTKTKTADDAFASLNHGASVPVLAVLGDTNLVGDGVFALAKMDDGVRAEKRLPDGLRLVKEFHIGSNYLVNTSVRLENTTAGPLSLPPQEWVVGTATPMDVDDNNFLTYGGAMWCDGAKTAPATLSYFNPSTTSFFFFPRIPKTEYLAGTSNVVGLAGEQPVFHGDGNDGVERAGMAGGRAPGHTAGIFERRAGSRRAATARNPGGAGLSGADVVREFGGDAANRPVRRA